jgi:hypothetical protein
MFKAMDDLCKQQRRLKLSSSTTFKRILKQLHNSLVGMVEPTQERRTDHSATLGV